jgi:hypothetical protein
LLCIFELFKTEILIEINLEQRFTTRTKVNEITYVYILMFIYYNLIPIYLRYNYHTAVRDYMFYYMNAFCIIDI